MFLRCPVASFKHRDAATLARALRQLDRQAKPLVLTDGVFAHDGEIAPLKKYLQALPANGTLLMDDAHGAGTLGASGRGTAEWLGIADHRIIQTATFSKAFGVYGGAVLGDEALGRRIIERSAAIIGNTPLPLPLAAGALASLKLANAQARRKLRQNIELFWREVGAQPAPPLSPIIAFVPSDPERVRADLLRAQIYPSLIRYPGGPAQGYFRFAISSEHTAEPIASLAEVIARAEILAD